MSAAQFPMSAKASFVRINGLDGMRLIAVLIVVIRHFEISLLVPGGLGVTVFFFISGFLITRLLLAEEAEQGRIHLKSFFIRRFIRLLPPLLLMGVVCIPLLAFFLPERFSWSSTLFNFLYLGNFHGLALRFSGASSEPMALGALWSLAVEEHFYIMLPALLVFVTAARQRMVFVLWGACIAPVFLRLAVMFSLPADLADAFNYSFTLTRIDSIGWGVLAAMVLNAGLLPFAWVEKYGMWLLFLGGAVTLAATLPWSQPFSIAWRYTPQTLGIMVAFVAVLVSPNLGWLRAMLESAPIALLGRASYEIYLWHLPIFYLLDAYLQSRALATTLATALTIGVSVLAYKVTTSGSRNLRRKYGSKA